MSLLKLFKIVKFYLCQAAKNNYYKYFVFYDGFGVLDNPFYMDVHSINNLHYVASELGVKDKVKYYDNSYLLENEFCFDYDDEVIEDIVKFELENSLKERLVYLNIRKIMLNQLFSSKPKDLHSIIDVEEKRKTIKLKPTDKK